MWQGWLLYGVLLFWVLPAAFWRPSAFALAAAWFANELIYQFAGIQVPVYAYIIADAIVIAVIAAHSKHFTDWLILSIFPAMWVCYATMAGADQWWALYYLAMAQFVLAGPWPILQKIRGVTDRGPLRKMIWS